MEARSLLLVVAVCAVPVLAGAATAGTPITARVAHARMAYYAITGSTALALRAQLDARGPHDDSGSRFDAVTRWRYRWSWPGYGGEACRLSRATVSVAITTAFPRWTPPRGADLILVGIWRRYVRALARHESGHVRFAWTHRASVLRAIKRATCATAEAAAQRQLSIVARLNVSYDARTRHGATQGAEFP